MKSKLSGVVHFIVPVYNSADHVTVFLTNLRLVSQSIGLPFRWTIVVDLSKDGTADIVEDFRVKNQPIQVEVVLLSRRHGQQGAILAGFEHVKTTEVCVVADDDLRISLADLEKILNPVLQDQADMVIAQHPAKGFRKVTSFVFWFLYRLFAGQPSEGGRDLMFRALSGELVGRLVGAAGANFSVAIDSDRLSVITERVQIAELEQLTNKSRYSSLDRFRLFVELIVVSQKNLGHSLVLLSLGISAVAPALWILAGAANRIDMFSQSSILALVVVLMGSLNLLMLGATQISTSLLLESKGGFGVVGKR